MRDRDRYLERTARLREFLADDTELGMTVSARRRLSMLNRAVNDAESGIARLDPLFTEVRARYIDALFRVKPKSGWLRTITATAIQEACETHGPDDPLVTRLRLGLRGPAGEDRRRHLLRLRRGDSGDPTAVVVYHSAKTYSLL